MNNALKSHIESRISEIQSGIKHFKWSSVGGGSINQTFRITTEKRSFFVKINSSSFFKNGFLEEVNGLNFLNNNGANTPEIACYGSFSDKVYLILEWIESGFKTKEFWMDFGHQLALIHRSHNEKFGLDHSNFMGSLPQKNDYLPDYATFFTENRLIPQIKLASNAHLLQKTHIQHFQNLMKELNGIFPIEKPSAVHGDLWAGNFICSSSGEGILIDPAAHFGHREADIAMSLLFGGFSPYFYDAYNEAYKMENNWRSRMDIYNLYPLLIHLNLFGMSYLGDINRIISNF